MAQNQQAPPSGNDVAGSALFKKFISTAESYIRQPTRLKSLLTNAYKKASEKNDMGTLAHEAWETLQTMFRLIKASVSGEYTGVPTSTVAAAVAAAVVDAACLLLPHAAVVAAHASTKATAFVPRRVIMVFPLCCYV